MKGNGKVQYAHVRIKKGGNYVRVNKGKKTHTTKHLISVMVLTFA
jgi:hypothetical protein